MGGARRRNHGYVCVCARCVCMFVFVWVCRWVARILTGLRRLAVVEFLLQPSHRWEAHHPFKHGRDRNMRVPGRWEGEHFCATD